MVLKGAPLANIVPPSLSAQVNGELAFWQGRLEFPPQMKTAYRAITETALASLALTLGD